MKPSILSVVACALAISLPATVARAQSPLATKRSIVDASLPLMASDAWQTRSKGFYQLLRAELPVDLNGASYTIPSTLQTLQRDVPERADMVATALIALLAKENAYGRSGGHVSEEFESYHGDLALAVAGLGDKRALSPLLDILDTGGIAMRGVARLGVTAALQPLLGLASAPSETMRNAATITLGYLLDSSTNPEPITAGQRADIKAALVRATADYDAFIRISAVEGISRLSDADVTELLRRLADSDPASRISESGVGSVFPVRDAAKRALAVRIGSN